MMMLLSLSSNSRIIFVYLFWVSKNKRQNYTKIVGISEIFTKRESIVISVLHFMMIKYKDRMHHCKSEVSNGIPNGNLVKHLQNFPIWYLNLQTLCFKIYRWQIIVKIKNAGLKCSMIRRKAFNSLWISLLKTKQNKTKILYPIKCLLLK